MNNRIDAIYARQSVDKKDSISIESQIEFCKYELKGGNCKKYTDKGYSGRNTDRPKFQELVRDIKRGLIAKVVVYKLDRISRSILDFANMMELFQQYNVEFVSSTEKFDTSTPMGRAMLNICIVFAQLERETIQKRVTDAYYSRSQRGFKMGGKAPYGFHTEPIKMDGINTKKLVVNPDEAANIRLMFEMYAQPTTSYGDITRHFAEQGILFNGKELIRPTPAQLLLSSRFVQRRYCFPTGLLMLIRAYPQFPHLIFPASHVWVAFRADWIFMLFISFLRQVSQMSEGTMPSWGASTSIWSFKSFFLLGFTSRP